MIQVLCLRLKGMPPFIGRHCTQTFGAVGGMVLVRTLSGKAIVSPMCTDHHGAYTGKYKTTIKGTGSTPPVAFSIPGIFLTVDCAVPLVEVPSAAEKKAGYMQARRSILTKTLQSIDAAGQKKGIVAKTIPSATPNATPSATAQTAVQTTVQVGCAEPVHPAAAGSQSKDESERLVALPHDAAYISYCPRLDMIVTDFSVHTDTSGKIQTWTLKLEEK